jgi:hypothetical protein
MVIFYLITLYSSSRPSGPPWPDHLPLRGPSVFELRLAFGHGLRGLRSDVASLRVYPSPKIEAI